MTEQEVKDLMASSKSETEWNANISTIKAAFNGNYPPFWYSAIILSGLCDQTASAWGGSSKIKISTTL